MTVRSLSVLALAAAALTFTAAPASAVVINFSLSGDQQDVALSNGLDATVTLDALTDSVDLAVGVAQDVFINAGTLELFQGSNAGGSDTLTQTLTINSPASTPTSQSISQGVVVGQLAANPPFGSATASLAVAAGSPVIFALGSQYQLTVTPLSALRTGQTATEIPFGNNATFLLTAVPEPTTLATLGMSSLLFRRRRRA